MAFNVNEFISRGLEYGGARPSLFEVQMGQPPGIQFDADSVQKLSFMCQAAQLPAASMSSIEIPYFGRKIKVAGERSFDNWTLSIMNDEDFKVRSLFEKWSNALNSLETNIRGGGLGAENYKADLDVIQYAKDGEIIRAYTVIGAFPTDVSSIDVNWSSTGTVQTFSATLAYDYWIPQVENSSKGNANQYAGLI
jgi:hypothetical protein